MTQTEPTTTKQPQPQANRFTLSNILEAGKTQIIFFPQAPGPAQAGKSAQLNYQGPEGKFTFRGDDITQLQSRLGLLITVTLKPDLDAGELALTLVLPPVNLAGQRQQEFETLAIKTRSLGFVVDRSGAQLKYDVLKLQGIAEAAILPLDSPTESLPDAAFRGVTVTEVSLTVLRNPSQLQIIARGTVPSAGWTNPQLIPVAYVQAPPDCIYDFEFMATPPKGAAAQVITPIFVKQRFPAQQLRGVRVNGVVALLDGDLPDCGVAEA